jgi:hypothetical protein
VALPSAFGVQELGFFPGAYLNSRNTITLIIIAVVICSSDSPGQAQQTALQKPLDTTVCEIVSNPQKFDGRLVRFQAKFQSDGRHGSVLTELECVRGIIPFLPMELNIILISKLWITLSIKECEEQQRISESSPVSWGDS